MEVEADLYLIFTGWDALSTASMSLAELMDWHRIAIKRYEKPTKKINAQRPPFVVVAGPFFVYEVTQWRIPVCALTW
ncbi:GpE family phage tail protein [Vibrio campbellii]|uniref:GpE family phage tail protein n=1 Tax=Vibrio campbellii TaxID=680 RepID=UPI00210B8826|nr:GpE family phage tail protein [Vibrio campbellii]UTZ44632.1 GpE family phage tail protein [Vibrio campbellii]